jgi:hypothetical protein
MIKKRASLLASGLLLQMLVNISCGAAPVVTRPVEIRLMATIAAEEGSGGVAVVQGRVVDAGSRGEIAGSWVMVESERGAMQFDGRFTFSFPVMSVITLTVGAPGYQVRQEVLKVHYARPVTLTLEVPLEPVPARAP